MVRPAGLKLLYKYVKQKNSIKYSIKYSICLHHQNYVKLVIPKHETINMENLQILAQNAVLLL